jgi:hypothetical protein
MKAAEVAMSRMPPSLSSALGPAAESLVHDRGSIGFSDAITLPNVTAALSYNALADYVLRLPRPHLLATRFFAIKIDGIGKFYARTAGREYVDLLREVAQAIAPCLEDSEFSFAYAGEGVFVCIARGRSQYNPLDIEAGINQQLRSGNPAPIGLRICCGTPLRAGAFRSGESVRRVVRLAIDSALAKADAARAASETLAQPSGSDGLFVARSRAGTGGRGQS